MFSKLKPLIRLIAFDDGFFVPKTRTSTKLVGVISRLDNRVEGVLCTEVKVDSLDSTNKIIFLLKKSRFLKQVKLILLQGVNFAGFNLVDLNKLHNSLNCPVIVVFRRKPDLEKFKAAQKRFKNAEKRLALIASYPEIHSLKGIHFQVIGLDEEQAQQIIRKTSVHSNFPEPLRLAHFIASGITLGQSTKP